MSMGTIFQSIEILSKEKGIEPKVILDAVKDAMLVAARKHFHTTEDLVAEFDEKYGRNSNFRRAQSGAGSDRRGQGNYARSGAAHQSGRGDGQRSAFRQTDRGAGPHFGADGQAGDSAKSSRGRAGEHFFRIFGSRG